MRRVLFVCLGNACRSQMAEAFARVLGGDVMIAGSAGLTPAPAVARDTVRAMEEKKIDLRDHFPKHINQLTRAKFDLVINLCGRALPDWMTAPMRLWDVADPVGMSYEDHCAVRDEIEQLVVKLAQELRDTPEEQQFRGQGSGRLPL